MKQASQKYPSIALSVAALSFALTAPLFAQDTSSQTSQPVPLQAPPSTKVAPHAAEQAQRMVTARAMLEKTLDAGKDKSGDTFETKLGDTVHLDNGVELPKGSMLMGKVVDDDMNVGAASKLALRFTAVRLKDGTIVPVKATIVGMYPPTLDTEQVPDAIRSNWTPQFLVMDQVGVLKGVDLHSRIGGTNSGTLVSSTKSEMKLSAGSQFALAIRAVRPASKAEATEPAR
jgi:hypothetical protein